MTFGQRLIEAREAKGMNQKQLAEALGITPTRLNYWEKDKRQPEISMIQALAATLEVTADYLIGNPTNKKSPALSGEAIRLARDYDVLDTYGQRAVRAVTDAELDRLSAEAPAPAPETKVIPFILQSFAAGNGEPDFGNLVLDTYEVPADSKAEFACRVHGDSLEPYYHDGDIALGVKRDPEIGEVAAWFIDGEYKIKQYVADSFGNLYLFALNRKRADTDQTVWAREEHTVGCLGTLLMSKRPPLPEV